MNRKTTKQNRKINKQHRSRKNAAIRAEKARYKDGLGAERRAETLLAAA